MNNPLTVTAEGRIITDSAEWQTLVDGPFRDCSDVFHQAAFVWSEARRLGATPGLVLTQAEGHSVGLALLFRDIPGHPGICDATSVYGYNGLLFSGRSGEPVPQGAIEAIERMLYLRGCVAVFNRGHPLRPAQLPGRKVAGETILVDLAAGLDAYEQGLATGHRYWLRRMRADGVRAELDVGGKNIDVFHRMYFDTMERLGASAGYLFPFDYIREQFAMPSNDAQLWFAWVDGRPAAASLFFRGRHCGHYHLSASDRTVTKQPATKLILDEFIRAEIALGHRAFLHLGGGVGAAVDSLNQFKRGFAGRPVPFTLTRWIVRPSDYDLLSEGHAADFFPAYRNPG